MTDLSQVASDLALSLTAQPGYVFLAVAGAALVVTGTWAQISQVLATRRGEGGIRPAEAATSFLDVQLADLDTELVRAKAAVASLGEATKNLQAVAAQRAAI